VSKYDPLEAVGVRNDVAMGVRPPRSDLVSNHSTKPEWRDVVLRVVFVVRSPLVEPEQVLAEGEVPHRRRFRLTVGLAFSKGCLTTEQSSFHTFFLFWLGS